MPSNSSTAPAKIERILLLNKKNEWIRTTLVGGTATIFEVEDMVCYARWHELKNLRITLPIISYIGGDGMIEAETLHQIVKKGDQVVFGGYISEEMHGVRAQSWNLTVPEILSQEDIDEINADINDNEEEEEEEVEAEEVIEKKEIATQTEDIEEKPEDSPPESSEATDSADAADARPGCVIC